MKETQLDFEAKVKEWTELTFEDYTEVVLYFIFSTKENRHFMMRLLKKANRDFKNLVVKKTDHEKIEGFYDIYSNNYQVYDMWVRFGDEFDQNWAMWIKMNALGMNYEEVLQDSKRRDAWIPLEEKRKGNW